MIQVYLMRHLRLLHANPSINIGIDTLEPRRKPSSDHVHMRDDHALDAPICL